MPRIIVQILIFSVISAAYLLFLQHHAPAHVSGSLSAVNHQIPDASFSPSEKPLEHQMVPDKVAVADRALSSADQAISAEPLSDQWVKTKLNEFAITPLTEAELEQLYRSNAPLADIPFIKLQGVDVRADKEMQARGYGVFLPRNHPYKSYSTVMLETLARSGDGLATSLYIQFLKGHIIASRRAGDKQQMARFEKELKEAAEVAVAHGMTAYFSDTGLDGIAANYAAALDGDKVARFTVSVWEQSMRHYYLGGMVKDAKKQGKKIYEDVLQHR